MVPPAENRSFLDQPEILRFIFYPRKEGNPESWAPNATNVFVPVERDVSVGCRFYHSQEKGPNLLFFHGNGEIVSDYDFIAPLYGDRGINLFVADYRGYGLSGGTPTTRSMIHDAHPVFQHFLDFLKRNRYTGPIFVMGRSLGSASALELGSQSHDQIQGIVIESGFADTFDLLNSLGIPMEIPPGTEDRVFSNLEKIRGISLPTLIIHGSEDHIIPLNHARDLYQASPAKDKRLVIIADANHNDLLMVGHNPYFGALEDFIRGVSDSNNGKDKGGNL